MNSSEAVNIRQHGNSPSVIAELIGEIEQFVQTRTDLFKAEMRQKLPHLRNAALLGVVGGFLLATGYLFVALAVVVLIAAAFPPGPYRWFFGFLIVGIVSVGFGAIGAFLAKSEFDFRSIVPKRTLTILKGDMDSVRSEGPQK